MPQFDLIQIYIACIPLGIGLVCGLSLQSLIEVEALILRFLKVVLLIVVIGFAIAIFMAGPMMLWFTLPVFWFGSAFCVLLFIGFVGGMLIRNLFCYISGFSRKEPKEPQTMSDQP